LKRNPYFKIFFKFFSLTFAGGLFLTTIVMACSFLGFFGGLESIDIDTIINNSSTQIMYLDEKGNEKLLTTLSSEQNRVWVDFENIPQDMKDAIVAIEDERFYSHKGFDVRRTAKAFFVFIKNKFTGQPTTFGGSTITQQLVKNITQNTERTAARKIKEISSAVNLERKISKDKILELYLNSIYLSQGCSGVQAASHEFFGKPVNDLNLAECASIAGITQYPSLYDPLINPENNKEKQEVVLDKMLELGYITQEEHDEAVAFELQFSEFDEESMATGEIHSYFVDQIIYDMLDELTERGYSTTIANKMIYSGGLKVIATIDPKVQNAMEKVYKDTSNFPNAKGENPIQSAMVIIDPKTGQVKGMVGGIGRKSGNLVLNRATQSLRQPGSTIKPIGVYAPALDNKIITASDVYIDRAIRYGSWTPRNYDHTYSGAVSVRNALRRSLNTIPVQILDQMGPEVSFDFLSQNLGITSLVKEEVKSDGRVVSDIGFSQLALGGMTYGVSVLELTAAYVPFANRGIYTTPHCYTKILDAKGKAILETEPEQVLSMSEETAFIMNQLMKEVVTSGTGVGAQLPGGMHTAGKTGTTSDNHDRWFVGFTPYYVGSVWYGYDTPRPIYAGGNPCIPVWKKIMTEIHEGKEAVAPEAPAGVKYMTYCAATGRGAACEHGKASFWFEEDNGPRGVCRGNSTISSFDTNKNSSGVIVPVAPDPEEEENAEGTEATEGEETATDGEGTVAPEGGTASGTEGSAPTTGESAPPPPAEPTAPTPSTPPAEAAPAA